MQRLAASRTLGKVHIMFICLVFTRINGRYTYRMVNRLAASHKGS
jgi:hypothetical protein